jgi:hypothetical protein
MPEGKLLTTALIVAALAFPAVGGGSESASDRPALTASIAARGVSSKAELFAGGGERGGIRLSRRELLRLLAAAGTASSGSSQSRFVQLILVMALATEGLPLLRRELPRNR